MTIHDELILRVISSYCDENGVADFIYKNINVVCKNDCMADAIKRLETQGHVKDVTKNGYAKRLIVNTILDCPDFIFDDYTLKVKQYLLTLWKEYKETGQIVNTDYLKELILQRNGITHDVVINSKTIHNKIESDGTLVKDDNGYRVITTHKTKVHYCLYCGETDPSKFADGQKSCCKKCQNDKSRKIVPLEERLYIRSKKAAKSKNREYDLDPQYIKELLEKQNYKCCYSGVQFSDNFTNKVTYPTLDRINSSLGYVKGNVCICSYLCNLMKGDQTMDEFKESITKIYNTIGAA